MSILCMNTKIQWLCTSPALTVMIWGVKFAPTEHATQSPRRSNCQSISNQDTEILIPRSDSQFTDFKQHKAPQR